MAEDGIKFHWRQQMKLRPDKADSAEKVNGVAVATVFNNIDSTGEARVQLMLPWLPGFLPWARLASPMAPMTCEAIYQDLRREYDLDAGSVHLQEWVEGDTDRIDEDIEKTMEILR